MPGISLMCFLEQDRTTTTSATSAKPLTKTVRIVTVSVVDGNFAVTVMEAMSLVKQIDPDEPENMVVLFACCKVCPYRFS